MKTKEQRIEAVIESFDNVLKELSLSGKLTVELSQAIMNAKTQSIIAIKGDK